MPPVVNDSANWLKQAFPFPVVVTLVLYTMGASSFISTWKADMEARVNALEKVLGALNSHENRIVVLEQKFIGITDDLSEIKMLLRERVRSDHGGATP